VGFHPPPGHSLGLPSLLGYTAVDSEQLGIIGRRVTLLRNILLLAGCSQRPKIVF
jgi:hypothetical protein